VAIEFCAKHFSRALLRVLPFLSSFIWAFFSFRLSFCDNKKPRRRWRAQWHKKKVRFYFVSSTILCFRYFAFTKNHLVTIYVVRTLERFYKSLTKKFDSHSQGYKIRDLQLAINCT